MEGTIFPNLKMAASAFISEKLDSCTNESVLWKGNCSKLAN